MAKVIRIRSEAELARYIRQISESSSTKFSKFQDDPRQVYFTKARQADDKYYDLDEEDEQKPAAPRPEAQGQATPQGQALENPPNRSDDEKQSIASDLNVSLDSISKVVKQMRGGKSVDDSAVETELRTYFDRLDDPSRKAMFVFFKSFADILTGQTTGASAQDPEDSPVDLKIEPGTGSKDPSSVEEPEPEAEPEEEEENSEDTSAPAQVPIAVGKQQVKEEVRRKLTILMRR